MKHIELTRVAKECKPCESTGVWICVLDDSNDVTIQRCDHCKALNSDAEAVKLVTALIYKKVNTKTISPNRDGVNSTVRGDRFVTKKGTI